MRLRCEKSTKKVRRLYVALAMPQSLFRAITNGMDEAAKLVAETHSLTFSWSGDKMIISADNDSDLEVANEMRSWLADELFLALVEGMS